MPTSRRRKSFTADNASPLDRNLKARVLFFARAYNERERHGRQHKGPLTRTFLDVLRALLWQFHNSRSGLCIPSYEAVAAAAGCARSTVAEALKALELAGVISWLHRIKREWSGPPDLFGRPTERVVRNSNSYAFHEVGRSKSEFPTGTPNQAFDSLTKQRAPAPAGTVVGKISDGLGAALAKLGSAIAKRREAQ